MATIPIASIITTRNQTILNAFYLPDGAAREQFFNYFLLEYGEFSPIYTEPAILADHIKSVGKLLQYTLDKLYASMELEYNPLENYDRQEEWTDTGSGRKDYTGGQHRQNTGSGRTDYIGSETHSTNHTVTETPAGSETESTSSYTTEHQVAADNTGTYFPSTQDIVNKGSPATVTRSFSERVTTTTDNGTTDSLTYNGRADSATSSGSEDVFFTGRADLEQDNSRHQGRVHGNIGVLTSQQMLTSEREVAMFSFYAQAALLYASHLLVMCY